MSLIAAALRAQEERREAEAYRKRTPKPYCLRGHKRDKIRPNGWLECTTCKRASERAWVLRNRAKKTAYQRLWYRRSKA